MQFIHWTTGTVGKLSLRADTVIYTPLMADLEWDTMTAMPAVNTVFDVAAVPPGILTLKDVGLPSAPAGVWLRANS